MSWEITNRLNLCVTLFLPVHKKELKGIFFKSTPWGPRNKIIIIKPTLIWNTFFWFFPDLSKLLQKRMCAWNFKKFQGKKQHLEI